MNKGFSLVELIVVIAIMAILVGVAVPVYTSYITKANNNVDAQLVEEIDHAIEILLIDQDVKNPASGAKITLTKAGALSITPADVAPSTVNTDFLNALKKILNGNSFPLKGDTYANGVTFEISTSSSGYLSCSYDAIPATP